MIHWSILFLRKISFSWEVLWVIWSRRMPPKVLLTTFSRKLNFAWSLSHVLWEHQPSEAPGQDWVKNTYFMSCTFSPRRRQDRQAATGCTCLQGWMSIVQWVLRSVTLKVSIYNYSCSYLCGQTWVWPGWSEAVLEEHLASVEGSWMLCPEVTPTSGRELTCTHPLPLR